VAKDQSIEGRGATENTIAGGRRAENDGEEVFYSFTSNRNRKGKKRSFAPGERKVLIHNARGKKVGEKATRREGKKALPFLVRGGGNGGTVPFRESRVGRGERAFEGRFAPQYT